MSLAQFQDPAWLWLLALLPPLVWLHHRRRLGTAITYSRLPALARRGRWRLHLPFYLRLAALALLTAAMARPQLGYSWEESLTEGIDIQVVLDVSGSMAAEDFQPRNRLAVAKEVVRSFIAQRPADRIGVTVFSGAALTRAPLTTDHQMLDLLVDSVELNTLPDGTAIGVALASAAARLRDQQTRSRIVILVTDGANNAGAIDPRSAAAVCRGLGIKVYTVGVGTHGRVPLPVPVRNPFTGAVEVQRVLANVEMDEVLLQAIAERTGGRFYHATDRDSLRQIFGDIDRLEKSPIATKRYVRFREAFQPLAWSALALLLAPLGLAAANLTVEP